MKTTKVKCDARDVYSMYSVIWSELYKCDGLSLSERCEMGKTLFYIRLLDRYSNVKEVNGRVSVRINGVWSDSYIVLLNAPRD